MAKIIRFGESKAGNWVYLQQVTCSTGSWKWARTRFYYRLVVTNMDPRKWGARKMHLCWLEDTPGVVGCYETDQVCGDYEGGTWGYGKALEMANYWFEQTVGEELDPGSVKGAC